MSHAARDRAPDPGPEPPQYPPLDPDARTRPGRHASRALRPARDDGTGPSGDMQAEPTFPRKPFLRTGYDRHAVDEFVAEVVLAVHDERQTSVSADDVARSRFPGRRFGPGYRMREVDDYLGVVEALLRTRASVRGVGPDPRPTDAVARHRHQEHHHRDHHPTWWIYGIALLLVVVIVVFTVTQN